MKKSIILAAMSLLVSSAVYASGDAVPEFFFQPEEGATAVEGGVSYADSTDSDLNADVITLRASAMHGLTHGFALRLGTSYSMADDANGGDGMNNFNLDLVAHRDLGGLTLHYGILGSITPSKTGSQRFGTVHTFNPYLGVSMGMGEHMKVGARAQYNAIATSSPVWGDDYSVALFAEMFKQDRYLLGGAVDYMQRSGMDDAVSLSVYNRIYMSSFILLPRLSYTLEMDDAAEDSFGVELAARFTF